MRPVPGDGGSDKFITRTGYHSTTKDEGEEIPNSVDIEGESKINDGPPGVGEARGVQKEGEARHQRGDEADGGPKSKPSCRKLPLCLPKVAVIWGGAGIAGLVRDSSRCGSGIFRGSCPVCSGRRRDY